MRRSDVAAGVAAITGVLKYSRHRYERLYSECPIRAMLVLCKRYWWSRTRWHHRSVSAGRRMASGRVRGMPRPCGLAPDPPG